MQSGLLDRWRTWRDFPSTQPPWAAALRYRLSGADPGPAPDTGLADERGYLAEAPSRVLGALLGGAVGEASVRRRPGEIGERTSAALFVLEGLVRAHASRRAEGGGDPVDSALTGLQRWLHARGIAWEDCVPDPAAGPDGWLVGEPSLRGSSVDDPAMLVALARIAAGQPAGTRERPVNRADSAGAAPIGPVVALWSADPHELFSLASDIAALTHGHSRGHHPAGVLAVTTSALLRGSSLLDSVEQGLRQWQAVPASVTRAVSLGRDSPPGFLPAQEHVEAAHPGRDGASSLGAALRIALAGERDVPGALAVAADHDPTTAVICGQLLGALHGPTALPQRCLLDLPPAAPVERLSADAVAEFGPAPPDSESWRANYLPVDPVRAPRFASGRDRFLGAVLGCGIGEALGTPITSEDWDEIRSRHGEAGLREYVPAGHPSGRLGSDTQLVLFSLEGTVRAHVRSRRDGTADPARHVQHAYQRWLHTQHLSWARAAGEFLERTPEPDGWLVHQRALFQTRNPGRTMMRTLIAFAKGQQAMGTPDEPVSDSRGSSAVMRAVPAALWSADALEVFRLGTRTAALTHGSPAAYLSAGALGLLVARLIGGDSPRSATEVLLEHLADQPGHGEVSRKVLAALRLAADGPVDPAEVDRNLGSGWTAPEALGIGLYAALAVPDDLDRALAAAVNHSGNSATTGAVCGSLLGARLGGDAIPKRWVVDLELHDVVEQLVHDAAREFGPEPPEGPDWTEKYPPT